MLTLEVKIPSTAAGFNMARALQANTDINYRVISSDTGKPAAGQSLFMTRTLELLHSDTFCSVFVTHLALQCGQQL